MATLRQKKAAKLVVENLTKEEPLTGGEIVESSGYGPSMKKNPQVVLNSEGVKEELALMGFSVDEADRTVAGLLKYAEKEETQIKAAQEIYKRLGAYAAEKHANFNLNMQVNESNEALEEAAKAYGAAAIKRRIS